LPALGDLAEQYDQKDLVVLAVNVEKSASNYQKWIDAHPFPYLVWARDASGEIADSYQVRGLPTTYVLDQDGVIRYVHVGWGSRSEKTLARELDSLLE